MDARRAFRFSVGLAAGYNIYNDWYECEIIDVSSRGAALKTRQVFMRGDTLRLRIAFEKRSALIDAQVAWQSGCQAGIVFSELDRDCVESFLTLLDDILVHKARVEVKDFFKKRSEMSLPARSPAVAL
jgi:hypothetical protein